MWSQIDQSWDQEKERILTSLVEPGQSLTRPFGSRDASFNTSGSSVVPVTGRYAMDYIEVTYANQLYNYNSAKIKGK